MVFVPSCSDNSVDKASAKLAAGTQQALAEADTALHNFRGTTAGSSESDPGRVYTDTRRKIMDAISTSRASDAGIDQAVLAGGNIAFEHAVWLLSFLPAKLDKANLLAKELSTLTHQSTQLLAEQAKASMLLEQRQTQLADFQKLLDGSDGLPGLLAGIEAKQKELSALEQAKSAQEALREQATRTGDKIQKQADDLLLKAQSADNTEQQKHQLNQQAYQLLATKKQHLAGVMTAADTIDSLDSRIKVSASLIQEMQNQIALVRGQIAEIKKALAEKPLEQQQNIAFEMERNNTKTAALAVSLDKLCTEYSAIAQEASQLLSEAVDDYEKIKSPAALPVAKSALADSLTCLGNVYAQRIRFGNLLTSKFELIGGFASDKTKTLLDTAAQQLAQSAQQYQQKAMEYFDSALNEYADLDRFADDLGDDFACNVLKSHLLALKAKVSLAQSGGNQQVVEEAAKQIKQLSEKAAKFGHEFSMSFTAGYIEDKPFVPNLYVDNTVVYEGIKNQFQGWKKLKGKSQEAEVNRLIGYAGQKKQEINNPEFDKIIDPEVEQLKQALAKGFAETTVTKKDPNSR